MVNFIFIGNAEPLKLQKLDWDSYTFRQKNYDVHRATKTVQLVWKGEKISNEYDEYLQTLPLGPGTVYNALLIKLPAGKSIPSHVDSAQFFKKYHRIHVAIETNPQCLFTVGEETIHMKPFEIWEIDNDSKLHSVTNGGTTDRVHLMIDFKPLKMRLGTHNKFLEFSMVGPPKSFTRKLWCLLRIFR